MFRQPPRLPPPAFEPHIAWSVPGAHHGGVHTPEARHEPTFSRRWVLGAVAGALTLGLAGCPPPPAPRGPTWTVRLLEAGDDPAAVVAAVQSVTGYTEKIASRLVAQTPKTSVPLNTRLSREEAEAQVQALRAAGARADAVEVPGD